MNKKIYIGIFSLFVLLFQAQVKVSNAEYYWDTDPGEGNGTAFNAADGNFDNVIESVLQNTSSVPSGNGYHIFAVRFKDSLGNWAPVFKNVIHTGNQTVTNTNSLIRAEYFWDTDPGEGNATALSAEDGNFNSAIETILQNGIPIAQPQGFHVFNIRVKDNQGVWGPVFKNVIYIESVLGTKDTALSKNNLVCYPNPVEDLLKFNTEGSVKIYSATGQLLISKEYIDGNKGVDVSSLIPGNYTLTVENKKGKFNSRFIRK